VTAVRTLRVAVVGYGFIASRGHVPAFLQSGAPGDAARFEVVAVADVTPARRALAAAALPGARLYSDYLAMLDREAAGLDFVVVAVPPSLHAEVARAALARGLHVLCEKPLARSTEEARGMIAAAQEAGRVLFPCHNYKHAPVVKAVRALLDEGAIGEVSMVTLHTFRSTHAKGVAEWNPDWRRQRAWSGGGIGMDHGSHTFYLAFDWLKSEPRAVSARTLTPAGQDTEDNLSCSVDFDHGVATAHLTWTAGVRKVIYTLHGDRGAIRVEDDAVELSIKTSGPEGDRWTQSQRLVSSAWMDASHTAWFRALHQQFAGAVERDEFVGPELLESLQCVALIEAAYASAEARGREVMLPRKAA
jgi:predicted dehydrogenase